MPNSSVNDIIKCVIRGVIFLITSLVFYAVYKKYITTYSLPKYAPNKEFVADNGEREVAEVLFFYTNWCPYCKNSFPAWETLKGEFKIFNNVEIVYKEIDCEKDKETADKYDIKGYPTIKMLYKNTTFEYDAKPDVETLKRFIRSSIKV